GDADVEAVRLRLRRLGLDVDLGDAGLPLAQGLLAVVDGQRGGGRVVGGEDELVDVAAEVESLDPLARRGAEDDEDRFPDVLFLSGRRAKPPRDDLPAAGTRDAGDAVRSVLDGERLSAAMRAGDRLGAPRRHLV